MPVVKYKLIRVRDGMTAPEYIKDGGYWGNPDDQTMIGWVEDDPEYGFDESQVEVISKTDFVEEQVALIESFPFTRTGPGETPVEVTEADYRTELETFYDDYVTSNRVIPQSPTQKQLDALKKKKQAEAFAAMTKKLEDAVVEVPIASAAANLQFGCDKTTQDNIIGVNAAIARNVPVGNTVSWMPKGQTTPADLTQNELAAVGGALLNKKEEYYNVYFTHKAAIYSANDYATIINLDVTTGYN